MDQLAEFLSMGGYGAFVWPAYGLAMAVLVGMAWASRRILRHRQADLARLAGADPVGAERRQRRTAREA